MSQKSSLTALAREQLELARAASSGRSAHTVFGGHEHVLHQTLIALVADHGLDDTASTSTTAPATPPCTSCTAGYACEPAPTAGKGQPGTCSPCPPPDTPSTPSRTPP